MKQIFAIAVVLLGSCVSNVLYAETQEFHISIGYATPSVSNIGSSFGHSFLLVKYKQKKTEKERKNRKK